MLLTDLAYFSKSFRWYNNQHLLTESQLIKFVVFTFNRRQNLYLKQSLFILFIKTIEYLMLRIQKPFTLVKAFAYSKINSNAPVRHVFAAFHICIYPDNRRLVASRFATHQRTKEGKTNFSEDDSC